MLGGCSRFRQQNQTLSSWEAFTFDQTCHFSEIASIEVGSMIDPLEIRISKGESTGDSDVVGGDSW